MAVRPIDANVAMKKILEYMEDFPNANTRLAACRAILSMLGDENQIPTFTPPNEPLPLDSRLSPKMTTCPKGWQGVRDTRFYCPGCKKAVKKGEAYCHKCGQALMFPVQRYDKENNRIWLDFSDRRPPEG